MIVGSTEIICFTRSNSPALIASMNAAELEETSGMARFYRFRSKTKDITAERAELAEQSIFSAISARPADAVVHAVLLSNLLLAPTPARPTVAILHARHTQ